MKALVISGGGSYGSFAVGVLEQLLNTYNRDYDLTVGTSTGALVAPFAALNDIKSLTTAYTTTTHDDVFALSPFKVKDGKQGRIRYLSILWQVIKGARSLGDSSNLEKTIKKYLTPEVYKTLQELDKKVFICVSNLSTRQTEYMTTDLEHNDFVKMMHASSSVPPFMSVIEHKDNYYVDGGVAEQVPIQKAINLGATEIDVIALSSEHRTSRLRHVSNVFDTISGSIGMMMDEIFFDDIKVARLKAQDESVKLNMIYRPSLIGDSLVFHPPTMKRWMEKGRKYDLKLAESFTVSTNGRIYSTESNFKK